MVWIITLSVVLVYVCGYFLVLWLSGSARWFRRNMDSFDIRAVGVFWPVAVPVRLFIVFIIFFFGTLWRNMENMVIDFDSVEKERRYHS